MRYSALLDCLLSLATVATELQWCRPTLTVTGSLLIEDGKHPLQEMCCETFIPNSTHLYEDEAKMMILTGPNACGKSIYLKQVGLIVFLAHLGSWIPARSGSIPIFDRISSRILTIDSLSLGLSAFAVDLNQMARGLHTATKSSLVLIDEFGKGSLEEDGQALLAASLEAFLEKNPFVIVSTHFRNLCRLLPQNTNRISFFTFQHEIQDEKMIFLYKLVPGYRTSSYSHVAALKAGISRSVIERAFNILTGVAEGRPLKTNWSVYGLNSEIGTKLEAFLETDFTCPTTARKFIKQLELRKYETP